MAKHMMHHGKHKSHHKKHHKMDGDGYEMHHGMKHHSSHKNEKHDGYAVSGSLIHEDYTKHANVPDQVIYKDMMMRHEGGIHMYDDTVEGMDRQAGTMRKDVSHNKPRSRY